VLKPLKQREVGCIRRIGYILLKVLIFFLKREVAINLRIWSLVKGALAEKALEGGSA
jgi:hypothetical protein